LKAVKQIFRVKRLFDGESRFLDNCLVCIEAGQVARIVEQNSTEPEAEAVRDWLSGVPIVDEPNGFMIPGLINSHHHAYSALARGMPITGSLASFPEILENIWWRLDRVLDEEAVRLSAAVTAIDCIRHGCTATIDHHSSPNAITGSLETIASVFRELSMTGVLCFETSDRNGERVFQESIDENLAFAAAHRNDKTIRGLFGLHAGFTLSDESLTEIAARKPANLPVHIHVAEDSSDVEDAKARGYKGPLARLHELGVLPANSLIAHGVHLSGEEYNLIGEAGIKLVHNPQSNCNNRVGYGDVDQVSAAAVFLGTDGMNSDMFSSAQSAYLLYKALGGGARNAFGLVKSMLIDNPANYLSGMFDHPVGRIVEGEPADFAIFDYPAPTPVNSDNVMSHFMYGLAHAPTAKWVYANGACVMENGKIKSVDEHSILAAASEKASHLWADYLDLSA